MKTPIRTTEWTVVCVRPQFNDFIAKDSKGKIEAFENDSVSVYERKLIAVGAKFNVEEYYLTSPGGQISHVWEIKFHLYLDKFPPVTEDEKTTILGLMVETENGKREFAASMATAMMRGQKHFPSPLTLAEKLELHIYVGEGLKKYREAKKASVR